MSGTTQMAREGIVWCMSMSGAYRTGRQYAGPSTLLDRHPALRIHPHHARPLARRPRRAVIAWLGQLQAARAVALLLPALVLDRHHRLIEHTRASRRNPAALAVWPPVM